MKKYCSLILIIIMIISMFSVTAYGISNPFSDVFGTDYYYNPVLWAVEKGITTGTSATQFSPQASCTRGQIVTFLWRSTGSPEPVTSVNPFTDVTSNQYYYKAVLWAVEHNITTGTSATTFSPNEPCTRGQVATFLWRSNGSPASASSNPFIDVNSSSYFHNAVLWAVENGITNGTSANQFSPNATCIRGQIVTFLFRASGDELPSTSDSTPSTPDIETSTPDTETSTPDAETNIGDPDNDDTSGQTVYRTPSGSRYHIDLQCGGKNSYAVTLQEATGSGLTPCQTCTK